MIAAILDAGRLHTAAVANLLRAADIGEIGVYVGQVTAQDSALTYPYLVIYPQPAVASQVSQDPRDVECRHQWQVTAVGRTHDEAIAALDRSRMVYAGAAPDVPGWVCWPIRNVPGGQQVRPSPTGGTDPVSGMVLHYGTASFEYRAVPA